MVEKVTVIVSITEDIAYSIKHEKKYSDALPFETIPLPFNETIRKFMAENIGFDTGPIVGLVRLNNEPISLVGTAFTGDIKITDVLSISAGDLILELSISLDQITCIGSNRLFELIGHAAAHGAEVELIHEMLYGSLVAASIPDDDPTIFCFLPQIRKEDCNKFIRFDSEWRPDYSDILGGIEEIPPSSMKKF